MINYKKRWILAAIIMIFVGLAVFAGVMAGNQWNFEILNLQW